MVVTVASEHNEKPGIETGNSAIAVALHTIIVCPRPPLCQLFWTLHRPSYEKKEASVTNIGAGEMA